MESVNVLKQVSSKEVIDYATQKNIIITLDAVQVLLEKENFKQVLDELIEKNNYLIDTKIVQDYLIRKETKIELQKEVEVYSNFFKPIARELKPNYRILQEFDVTGQSNSEGIIEDFVSLFRDKFDSLKNVLKKRIGLNPKTTSRLNRISKGNEVDLIAMVSKKWVSKNGHVCFKVEDLEGEAIALILKDDASLMREAEKILLDDVIGIKGIKGQGDMIIIKQVFYPELPMKPIKTAERDLSLCTISDIHVGSKLFLEKEFIRFIEWLNGKIGDRKEQEKVGKIKYLIITGDLVDGIGVYPGQSKELSIQNIYGQYTRFQELIKQVPEYIEVFLIPGQHDAVRRAEPQPAIAKEFLPELSELKNFHLIGNPSWIELEGLTVLAYHGGALHDLYSQLSYLNPNKPQLAIMDALRRGTVGGTYGLRQTYAPEKKDFLVLKSAPDIYIGGDMHHNGYGNYRGTLIINNGTWQNRTDFQVSKGHTPTPGVVPVLELKTMKIIENYFFNEKIE